MGVLVFFFVIAAILFATVRIILGWTVSKQTARRVDAAAQTTFKAMFVFGVLAIVVILALAFWLGSK